MSTIRPRQQEPDQSVLIFVAGSAASFDAALADEAERHGCVVASVSTPREALCNTSLAHALGVVMFVGSDDAIEPAATILACLHERWPQLPLAALARTYSEPGERRLRVAGASAYVAGPLSLAVQIIMDAQVAEQPRAPARRETPERSPPRARRRRVLPRIRGRP